MNGIEHLSGKETLPEIRIERYTDADRDSVIAGIADIQEVERNLSDTRRPAHEMVEEYFAQISQEVAEKHGAIFVARSGEKVAGFITCWIERDNDPIQTDESNVYAYISDVWVAPELRDRGIFGTLNEEIEKYVRQFPDVHFIRLNVVATNERAKAAYAKTGYAPEEIKMSKRIIPAH